jgi:hypothetical protein
VVNRIAPAAGRMRGDELGQDLCDGRGVVVSGDLGIAGHGYFPENGVAKVNDYYQ